MYRLPAIAAILFYWITMEVVQQLTCLTLGRPNGPAYSTGELFNTPPVSCSRSADIHQRLQLNHSLHVAASCVWPHQRDSEGGLAVPRRDRDRDRRSSRSRSVSRHRRHQTGSWTHVIVVLVTWPTAWRNVALHVRQNLDSKRTNSHSSVRIYGRYDNTIG